MAEYGTGRDGATWYWHAEKQADGMYAAVIECYGYWVTIDGIWFYAERDCLDWIAEAAKAGVREDATTDADDCDGETPDAAVRPPGAEFTLVRDDKDVEFARLEHSVAERDAEIARLTAELDAVRLPAGAEGGTDGHA